ncbi:hypothetical protein ABEB36_012666 [Hypothenemus hampei]|uniref:Transcription factor IIIC 90kDa subunit N-terminal domain-containing protein n=1 Tax=Hypothenemus hampei TaxID=57062 RepID=A0ABD1ECQ6_HYPHA
MTTLKLLDSVTLTGRLNTNFACSCSQDNRILIISETGVYLMRQVPDLNSSDSHYSHEKYFLQPSDYAVCSHVDININSFIYDLPKDVFYESVLSVMLSQNLTTATPITPSILSAQWSDAGMVDGVWSMLGVLTNLCSLEIYIQTYSESNLQEYKIVLNLTKEILEKRRKEFVYSTKMPTLQKMRELKKRVEYISPLTFTWSHNFLDEGKNTALLFIGHFHGDISIWKINGISSSDHEASCVFIGRYSSKLGHIGALYWHRTKENDGVLCAGDFNGKISVFKVSNVQSLEDEVAFYTENDTKVDMLTVISFRLYTCLIAVKQSYLLVFGLDSNGHVFDCAVHNVKNFYITGLTHKDNVIKVLTFTGKFKQLTISVHFKKIVIEEKDIQLKLEFSGLRTHGFIESTNNVLIGILSSPYRLQNAIQGKKFINFTLLTDTSINSLKVLMENPSGSLKNFWDCFEAIRLICLKEQRFPWLGLNKNMDLDNCSLIELKTLRLIAKISETIFCKVKRVVSYDIKPYVLLHYLVKIRIIINNLRKLFKDRDQGRELSEFEMRSIDLQVFFLKEVVVNGILPKAEVGCNFIKDISNILTVANELEYPDMIRCNFCGEKLIGNACLPPHSDSRCVFTMMPIFISPAYKCILCHSLALDQVATMPVLCPYCDYPMEKVCLNEKMQSNLERLEYEFEENRIYSKCVSDCFQDNEESLKDLILTLEDIQESEVEVSDGEQEESDIRELYFRLASLTMGGFVDEMK